MLSNKEITPIPRPVLSQNRRTHPYTSDTSTSDFPREQCDLQTKYATEKPRERLRKVMP